jgi:hypothetical protein
MVKVGIAMEMAMEKVILIEITIILIAIIIYHLKITKIIQC